MNPLRLRAANYRTFPTLDLHLPAGCVGVIGANGAGKSSIVGAIDTALFGPESRSLEPYLSEGSVPGDTLNLELELEHRADRYRIRRSYTMHNSGRGKTTCDFEKDAAGAGLAASLWEPLTQGDMKDTQALIEKTLGLTRETFRASAMLAQGDGAAFTEAQPRERKRILGEMLGLDFWEQCKTLAGRDRRDRETRIESLTGRIQLLDEQLAGTATLAAQVETLDEQAHATEIRLAEANDRTAAAKLKHQHLAERAQAATAARATLAAAQAELAALEREVTFSQQASAQAHDLEQSLPGLRERAELLAAAEAERDQLQAACHEHQLREQQRAALTLELEQVTSARKRSLQSADQAAEKHRAALTRIQELLNHAATRCDRCEQELPDDARARALASNEREADDVAAQHTRHARDQHELGEREEKLRAQVDQIEPSLPDDGRYDKAVARCGGLAGAREDLATAAERIAGLKASAKLRETFHGEFDAAARKVTAQKAAVDDADAPDPTAIDSARHEHQFAEDQLTRARTHAETAKLDLARARTRLEAVEKARGERDQATAEQDNIQGELDELQLLERAFGRDGVPTWILETSAIPALEIEADRLLGLLGTDYRVELRTERELKSGGAAETLDVILVTPTGERDYGTFSGGERTRLNLALRLALARLLANRRGAESRMLCIDEPEFLDAAGTERLVDALRDLGDDFDRVYLVSHIPQLRDAFDTTLQVTKTDGRSEVTVA